MKVLNILSAALISVCTLTSYSAKAEDPDVTTLSRVINEIALTADTADVAHAILMLETPDSVLVRDMFFLNDSTIVDSIPTFEQLLYIEREKLNYPLPVDTTIDVSDKLLPRMFFMPVVYKPYVITLNEQDIIKFPADADKKPTNKNWVDIELERHRLMEETLKHFCVQYPWIVKLNLEKLPEPPKAYVATVDPKTAKIKVEELKVDLGESNKEIGQRDIRRKNWLHTFNGSMQFSQAFNSPNWYQGGNNNVNLIGNILWNVKLNPKFYPNLLFENTVQYKLAINSAPDDTLRSYSISEDLFQVNSKFGLKASNNWYYSATMQFKTQLLQNHPTNSHSLKAAFLSPGELNIGLGMTYNKSYLNNKLTLGVSMNPLSYNMISYRNMSVTSCKGKKITNQYGSNVDAKVSWKPVYNITYTSRLYAFTNYEYLQGDWEHNIEFAINRFLTTRIYVHLRYDSSVKNSNETSWHQWQLKEILSFGFAYTFSTI